MVVVYIDKSFGLSYASVIGSPSDAKSIMERSGLALLLLLIFLQMFFVLVLYFGQFISTDETLISPFLFCLKGQDGQWLCKGSHTTSGISGAETNINIPRETVILSLYAPLALIPFALLALFYAVYGKDEAALRLSAVCQLVSSLLLLGGLLLFVGLHWPNVSLAAMTLGFYVCVSVSAELAITGVWTWVAGGKGSCV